MGKNIKYLFLLQNVQKKKTKYNASLNHFGRFAALEKKLLDGLYCIKLHQVLKAIAIIAEKNINEVSPAEVKFWLLLSLYIIADYDTDSILAIIPKWLRPSAGFDNGPEKTENLIRKIVANEENKIKLRAYFCQFPSDFLINLKNLQNKLYSDHFIYLFDENNKIRKIDDILDLSEMVNSSDNEKFNNLSYHFIYDNIIHLVGKISKFLEKSPIKVKVNIDLGQFMALEGENRACLSDEKIARLLLEKIVIEKSENDVSLSSCIQN